MQTQSSRSDTAMNQAVAMIEDAIGVEIVGTAPVQYAGHFNNAVQLLGKNGAKWVARIAPNTRTYPYLRFERGMLAREAHLAETLPTNLMPRTVYFNDGSRTEGRAILVRDYVEGINGQHFIDERPSMEDQIWSALFAFDTSLGAIKGLGAGFPSQEVASWSHFILGLLDDLEADLSDFGVEHTSAKRLRSLSSMAQPILDERPVRLCHGDLWPKNVIVSGVASPSESRLIVLDWERSFYGDPRSQWMKNRNSGMTLFSIDRAHWRARVTDSEASIRGNDDCPEALLKLRIVDNIYNGIHALQLLAESIRHPVDMRAASNLAQSAIKHLQIALG